jgi:hypothetical protein
LAPDGGGGGGTALGRGFFAASPSNTSRSDALSLIETTLSPDSYLSTPALARYNAAPLFVEGACLGRPATVSCHCGSVTRCA